MQFSLKNLLPHFVVLAIFVTASLLYFSPVLQGKQILQSDIVQYTGMAKQHNDYREQTGKETYWTNAAFGGMPTYQLGAQYPHNYIKKLDRVLRFLPRPADYLFLYFLGFYILMLSLKVNYRLAVLGALGFGFSTYLIIILGVGHNAKAHAIAYMPMVLGGIFLTFRKKYLLGFLVTCLAMALEISANHFQMTYYLMLLILVIGVVYLIDAFKKQILPHYFKAVGIMTLGVLLAVGLNATNLLATQEYAKESTRGKSELTINPDGTPKAQTSGLSKEYITEYSYGITETFNLLVPRFMGGGNSENLGTESELYKYVIALGASPAQARDFAENAPTYWGKQPIVAAPAYIGAVILFLAFLGMFLVKGKLKWSLVIASMLALALSWGKNFEVLTNFFIDYVPLYDKFRAVTSIQVIIELAMPILAVFGLCKWFSSKTETSEKQKAMYYSTGILGGVILFFLMLKDSLFSFSGVNDGYYMQAYGQQFISALKEDRATIFVADSWRSLLFVFLTAAALWLFLQKKLKQQAVIVVLGALLLLDLVGVDRRYVNAEDFVAARMVKKPFQENKADLEILKDDSHYRVFDMTVNPFNSARASFFHNAFGGYHAAKPGRIQELSDFHLDKGNTEVLNMFNVKYFIQPQERGGEVIAQENPYANGNAWFVDEVIITANADEEISGLSEIDTRYTALVHQQFADFLPESIQSAAADSLSTTSSIVLVEVQPDYLHYETENSVEQLAVFSELYYPYGWNAYINGKLQPHFRANYALRAMVVPEGYNKIEFKFEPKVVQTGSHIALGSSILLLLLLAGGIFYTLKNSREGHPKELTD